MKTATTTATDHPYVQRLHQATMGDYVEYTRDVEVGPALPGPCDAVAFLPGRTLVAADVDEDWVGQQLVAQRDRRPEDPSTGLGQFLAALTERLGSPPTYASVLATAPHRAAFLAGKFKKVKESDPGWSPYRTDVTTYLYDSPSITGYVDLGRGPGGRWDAFVRVDRDARDHSGGGSRQLLTAALTMVPKGEELYGAAPVHDIRALRTMLAGGFRPICTEVLFLTRPEGGGGGRHLR